MNGLWAEKDGIGEEFGEVKSRGKVQRGGKVENAKTSPVPNSEAGRLMSSGKSAFPARKAEKNSFGGQNSVPEPQ